ncbi:hypothetical protein [uncultured Megasphaera sp.]|uniref:hypothetical protein n=1 Tax=uncultured Megasphaera sp. TaxID=165188 RepID=UPI0026580BE8|nr:hypothetical protein [uncultured Megasphaera sp.]
MICPICGKEFTPRRSIQKYCSYECRRYANRHGANDVRPEKSSTAPVIREFRCLKCKKLVKVRDRSDGRMKFCSQHCEKLYWKHSKKVKAATVYREFTCKECGKVVAVTDPLDRRRIFCCRQCRIRWFSRRSAEK